MKQLLYWIKWGALIGVIISAMFLFAFENLRLDISVLVNYIFFGLLAGILITASNNLVGQWFSSANKGRILFGLLLHYLVSVLTFFSLALFYRTYIYSFFPSLQNIIGTSLGVGLASVVISLFWRYSIEIDERLKLEQQNRKLAVVEERNRIARELHDSVSQNLFGISLNLKTLKYLLNRDPDKAGLTIDQLQEMVAEIQTEMRLMIYELQPAALSEKGFFEALENLAGLFMARYDLEINCDFNGKEDQLDNKRQLVLYRVFQESLNNVARHANARKVKVSLEVKNERGQLTIKDDGKGFELAEINAEKHLGVRGMRERVHEVGGEFWIESALGKGTTVVVRV
ncbi:MAG: sensor histidine kinase [Firmicutes bacterium]|nr:sensor histidine kinase [Bacillota bacterium]